MSNQILTQCACCDRPSELRIYRGVPLCPSCWEYREPIAAIVWHSLAVRVVGVTCHAN